MQIDFQKQENKKHPVNLIKGHSFRIILPSIVVLHILLINSHEGMLTIIDTKSDFFSSFHTIDIFISKVQSHEMKIPVIWALKQKKFRILLCVAVTGIVDKHNY